MHEFTEHWRRGTILENNTRDIYDKLTEASYYVDGGFVDFTYCQDYYDKFYIIKGVAIDIRYEDNWDKYKYTFSVYLNPEDCKYRVRNTHYLTYYQIKIISENIDIFKLIMGTKPTKVGLKEFFKEVKQIEVT